MDASKPEPVSKVVNCFFEQAEGVAFLPGSSTTRKAKQALGGLWVGGRLHLSADDVRFVPNGLNRTIHVRGSVHDLTLALDDVVSVEYRSAFITNIVEISTADQLMRVRCYGARKLARQVDAARSTPAG